jgi:predicted short-subunit dehydrogenase-like oxidoreductase (DUF2520 family)
MGGEWRAASGERHQRPRVGFVGAGSTARVLALGLAQQEHQVTRVASRVGASARELAALVPGCEAVDSAQAVADGSDLVFLAVPDDAIGVVAKQVSWRPGQATVHCSGALGLETLAAAESSGARVGGFHPLQTLAGTRAGVDVLCGVTFAVEASEPLLGELERMARALGGRPIRLPRGSRTLYHAAAAFASNYVVTLADRAVSLWEVMGLTREEALAALLPLMRGTVRNLEEVGLPAALTGPVARGDVGTVRRHLDALNGTAPWLLGLYQELGLATLPVAEAKGGLSRDAVQELRQLLQP